MATPKTRKPSTQESSAPTAEMREVLSDEIRSFAKYVSLYRQAAELFDELNAIGRDAGRRARTMVGVGDTEEAIRQIERATKATEGTETYYKARDVVAEQWGLLRAKIRAAGILIPVSHDGGDLIESTVFPVARKDRKKWMRSVGRLVTVVLPALAAEVQAMADGQVWFTFAQAERATGVARGTLHRAAEAGRIKDNGKPGLDRRISAASVMSWNEARARGASEPVESNQAVERRFNGK